jgi:hypothetical protein
MKIYALEGKDNDYNTTYEVKALWRNRPDINSLMFYFNKSIDEITDENILAVVALIKGEADVKVPMAGDINDMFMITEYETRD